MNTNPDKENCLYFDITQQERDSAIRYLLNAIMKSRKESHFPSNYYTFDEDVNVYLAHLLFAVSLPEYHDMAEPYLSLETSDILRWVQATEDRTIRYFIFKVNADHLLIHSAIFDDIGHKPDSKFFKKSQKHFRELAQLYYEQAAHYHTRIYRKRTGVGEVLTKIAKYFDQYQNLLRLVRRDYFNFMSGFRDQAFSQFMNEVQRYEHEFQKQQQIDQLLDLYSQWLNRKDPQVEGEIQRRISEIRKHDADFQFDFDRLRKGGSDERKCA
jgi:hypothetical protein